MVVAMGEGVLLECPVCRGGNCVHDRPYQGKHDIFENRELVRCRDCGMVFVTPMPSPVEWDDYNRDFFSESLGGVPSSDIVVLFSKGVGMVRIEHIRSMVGDGGLPNSVLEIGPGPGYLSQAYKALNPDVRYCVVETDDSCHESLRSVGVDIFTTLEEVEESGAQFECLVLSHVLEHVADPVQFLSQALGLIERGGLVFIEVPCTDYKYKDVFDAHILFFDKEPMHRLLAGLGLVECRVSYHGEAIEKIRKSNSLAARIRRKVKSVIGGADRAKGEVPPYIEAPMWELVEPYEAHIEHEAPARWLRALARKPA